MCRKKYSKRNGYYKYYNKNGVSCRVKFENKMAINSKTANVIIEFNKENDIEVSNMHMPARYFNNDFEILNFILKNLETSNLVFKVKYLNRY